MKKGQKMSEEAKMKISIFNKGKKLSEETKRKISKIAKERGFGKWMVGNDSHLGFKHSAETRKKMSLAIKKGASRGKNHYMWKGGVSKNKKYMSWLKNKRNRMPKIGGHTWGEWENLKAQYNWTCPCCKKSEPEINLSQDHIIPLSKGGSDNIENIQPLCRSCNCKKMTKIINYLK